jgi:hypothetical protein
MRIEDGVTKVGTATIRENALPAMTHAQRLIFQATGNLPQPSALDDASIEDPFAPVPPSIYPAAAGQKKPSKYRNTRCEHQGIKFDSEKERSHWFFLIQQQVAGLISDLQLQVAFTLTERKQRDDGTWERASKYVADFTYMRDGKLVVEDVKSIATRKNRTYIQKRKLMLEKHDITVKEI